MPNYTDNTFTVRAILGARAAAEFSSKTRRKKREHPHLTAFFRFCVSVPRLIITILRRFEASDPVGGGHIFIYRLYAKLLADILRYGVLVHHKVHELICGEGLGHVPDAFVVAVLTP